MLATAWNRVTDETVEPWYRSTLTFDRHQLNAVHAAIHGEEYEPRGDDAVSWKLGNALGGAAGKDPDCLRALFCVIGALKTPEELFADPAFMQKVISLGADSDGDGGAGLGPDRKQLLEILSAG